MSTITPFPTFEMYAERTRETADQLEGRENGDPPTNMFTSRGRARIVNRSNVGRQMRSRRQFHKHDRESH